MRLLNSIRSLRTRLAAAVALLLAIAATLVALAPSAFAQGCVMCYTSASAANKQGERALDRAIIVLLLPPLAMFLGIIRLANRRKQE